MQKYEGGGKGYATSHRVGAVIVYIEISRSKHGEVVEYNLSHFVN